MSRWFFNISRDSKICLGNLCQCLVTLLVKKYFLNIQRSILCFGFVLLPLVLSLGTKWKTQCWNKYIYWDSCFLYIGNMSVIWLIFLFLTLRISCEINIYLKPNEYSQNIKENNIFESLCGVYEIFIISYWFLVALMVNILIKELHKRDEIEKSSFSFLKILFFDDLLYLWSAVRDMYQVIKTETCEQ